MRKSTTKADDVGEEDPTVGIADWKDSPQTVLEALDARHGLEVVTIETGADDYMFMVEKRQ